MTINDYVYNSIMGEFAEDNLLTPPEKKQILNLVIEIRKEYEDYIAKAEEIAAGDPEKFQELTAEYTAAYWALLEYLLGETAEDKALAYEDYGAVMLENGGRLMYLSAGVKALALEDGGAILLENGGRLMYFSAGVISDLSVTTVIDRDEYKKIFNEYYSKRDSMNLDKVGGDYTQTIIDGGLVTTGAVVLKGGDDKEHAGISGSTTGGDEAIRIWAGASKENKDDAPFRVNQAGEMWATNAHIEGEVNATSGHFKGEVEADSGYFKGRIEASEGFFHGDIEGYSFTSKERYQQISDESWMILGSVVTKALDISSYYTLPQNVQGSRTIKFMTYNQGRMTGPPTV
ncbi:MAG: hypothetical protein HUJ65_02205, partial [Oscillospiraceae bacterium]|nr:hypothetical protein [Oscillospiraceae bacterium]